MCACCRARTVCVCGALCKVRSVAPDSVHAAYWLSPSCHDLIAGLQGSSCDFSAKPLAPVINQVLGVPVLSLEIAVCFIWESFLGLRPHGRDSADDLVAENRRVLRNAPFIVQDGQI